MHFLYTLLIALANNVDNIGVRIAYSIRGINISFTKNLWISVITFLISAFAAGSGAIVSGMLSKQVSSIISMILLVAIGLWIIFEQYVVHKGNPTADTDGEGKKSIYHILKNPESADADNSKSIDFKEATILGIALSINNVGGGLSAGMIGLNPFFVGILSALVSFLALWTGNYLALFFKRLALGEKTAIIAGIILILLGFKQII